MSTIKYKTIQESWDTFNGVVLDKMKELHHILTIYESAIFSNLIGLERVLDQAHHCEKVLIDFNHCRLVDHSFMAFIHHAQNRFESFGGSWENIGLKNLKPLSKHELATRKFDKKYKAKS